MQIDNTQNIKTIQDIEARIAVLERNQIQLTLDPTVTLYLQNAVGRQIYSTLAPTGGAPIGSMWLRDTGVPSSNTLHVYSGQGWVQIK